MKYYFLIILGLLLFSCTYTKKSIIKEENIDIAYYSLGNLVSGDTIIAGYQTKKNKEKINTKSIFGDTTRFIYYYNNLMDYTDTLTIYKTDSLVLRKKLKFLSKKTIEFNGRSLAIKKYMQDSQMSNVFINDTLGMLLIRAISHPSGEVLVRYNTGSFYKVHKAIINDSVFFKGEY